MNGFRVGIRIITIGLLLLTVGVTFSSVQDASAQDATIPELPPELSGRIAYIGTDYNVYTIASTTNTLTQLTDDAGVTQNAARLYQLPTWSTDGRLAYFQTDLTRTSGTTRAFVSPDGIAEGVERYETGEKSFTYAYWSPQNCTASETCRELAILMSTSRGFDIDLVRDAADLDAETVTTVGMGAPFYYSWSPDGARMLWHRNQINLDIYDVSDQNESTLEQMPGLFAAPAWSPVDDRLLFGAQSQSGTTTDLIIIEGDEPRSIVERLQGPVYFAWSPDGNQIAYVDRQGALFVVDAVTGESIARSSVTGVLAFFWSPNSERIAFLTLSTTPGSFNAFAPDKWFVTAKVLAQGQATGLMWSVLDVATGETRRYGAFIPTREMIYLLSFYDQFAQSHRLWSPDSSHLLYSEITPDERPVISLLDTRRTVSVPLNIADGVIAIWSFE